MSNKLSATGSGGSFSKVLSGLSDGTTYYYQAFTTVRGTGDYASVTKTFSGSVKSFTTPAHTATVTTGAASNITAFGASVAASFSNATGLPREVRIEYGTSASSLTSSAFYNDGGLSAPAGSFNVTLSSLSPETTYYYRAVIQLGTKDFTGKVESFTTAAASSQIVKGFLELPAITGNEDYVGTFKSGSRRNYTYYYDYDSYTSLWVAYPLYASTMGGSGTDNWEMNPNLPQSRQVNVTKSSYGVNVGSTTSSGYDSSLNYYARGHMIPNGDRNNDATMQSQTFYVTNCTPQIQNKFNSGIWNSLEGAVRDAVPQNDTLYVVTGAAFNKLGESRTVVKITPKDDTKQVPVPNYYWKVLLKVKRGTGGVITAASAVGVWIDHREHEDSYTNYMVSVDQIEAWTGFDFFAALPSSLQSSAESNGSWTDFKNF